MVPSLVSTSNMIVVHFLNEETAILSTSDISDGFQICFSADGKYTFIC